MNSISFKRPSGHTVTSQNFGGAHFQTVSKPLDTVAARFEHIADQYGDRSMTVNEIEAAMNQAIDREGISDRLGEAGCLPNLESWGLEDPMKELEATLAYKAPEAHDQFAENMKSESCLAAVQGDDKYLDDASLLAAEQIGTKHINDQVNDANTEAAKATMKEQATEAAAAKPETGGKPEAGAKPAADAKSEAGAKPDAGGKPDSGSKS